MGKKARPIIYKKHIINIKHRQVESKKVKKIHPTNTKPKKAYVAIVMLSRVDFKIRNIIRDKEPLHIEGSISQMCLCRITQVKQVS